MKFNVIYFNTGSKEYITRYTEKKLERIKELNLNNGEDIHFLEYWDTTEATHEEGVENGDLLLTVNRAYLEEGVEPEFFEQSLVTGRRVGTLYGLPGVFEIIN